MLPAGVRYSDGTFSGVFLAAEFWTSTEENEDDVNDAYVRYLNYINKDISSCYGGKENMFSVRCVKD